MKDNFAQLVISQIDDGENILDIAQYFGGFDSFMILVNKFPYLKELVDTKLGGELDFYLDASEKRYKLPIRHQDLTDNNHFFGRVHNYILI